MTRNEIDAMFPVGTKVESNEGGYDVGYVMEPGFDEDHPMAAGPNIYVAWSGGTRCWTPVENISEFHRA
jgi:hypothetical protein